MKYFSTKLFVVVVVKFQIYSKKGIIHVAMYLHLWGMMFQNLSL